MIYGLARTASGERMTNPILATHLVLCLESHPLAVLCLHASFTDC